MGLNLPVQVVLPSTEIKIMEGGLCPEVVWQNRVICITNLEKCVYLLLSYFTQALGIKFSIYMLRAELSLLSFPNT